jgi:TfoX/Sxy family transcriptional regulator of competence genes
LAKYSEKLEDLLDHHLIANEELRKKKELGGVGYLINGNMCLGIYNDLMVARIGKKLAQTLVSRPGIEPYLEGDEDFEDFVLIKEQIYIHSKAMQKFIDQSIQYTRQLPPKEHDQDELI